MTTKVFNIEIHGYWRDPNRNTIPAVSGIYFVYEAAYDQKFDALILRRLIYIGESENIKESIIKNPDYDNWLNHVRYGNELCYAAAFVEPQNRSRIKAAFVKKHNPMENDLKNQTLSYEETIIKTTGEMTLLSPEFKAF